jgi:hypothetical protein
LTEQEQALMAKINLERRAEIGRGVPEPKRN